MKYRNPPKLTKAQQIQELSRIQDMMFFEKGYVDAYQFCYWLAHAIHLDGFSIQSPNPILDLLLQFPTDEDRAKHRVREVCIRKTISEEDLIIARRVYPEYKTIYIHISVFVMSAHNFIASIGEHILNLKPLDQIPLYSYWLTKSDIYTCEYFTTFFRELTDLGGESMRDNIVNLHLTWNSLNKQESLLSIIKEKEERHLEIKQRVGKAIEHGFFLEAIALQESIISDRLAFMLYSSNKDPKSRSFYELIKDCSKHLPRKLERDLDNWRNNRNSIIHNLVRSSPLEEQELLLDLDKTAESTALSGVVLMDELSNVFESFFAIEKNPFHFIIPEDIDSDTVH